MGSQHFGDLAKLFLWVGLEAQLETPETYESFFIFFATTCMCLGKKCKFYLFTAWQSSLQLDGNLTKLAMGSNTKQQK